VENVDSKNSETVTLSVRNVSKSFYGITVLSDFAMDIHRGEIVALIGQNGSGKSTFIKVLSGFHAPDEGGTFRLGQQDVGDMLGQSPSKTGMAFIHQDLPLVPSMTILENLRIARFSTGFAGRILWKSEARAVSKILAKVGLDVSPNLRIDQLSVTERALVAIARGLSEIEAGDALDAQLLVLDEPTAYLPEDGVSRLFNVLRDLSAQGVSILFVSHRLDEVLDHCARAVILRGGRKVGDVATAGMKERDLVEIMLGQPPEDIYPDRNFPTGAEVLSVSGLSGSQVKDISFSAQAGEVIGFVGLPGEGYDQIPYLLAGATRSSGGEAKVKGVVLDLPKLRPAKAIANGIALLPADRKGASGATDITVGANLTLPTLGKFTSRLHVLKGKAEREFVDNELIHATVTPPIGSARLATLSGGNQQKVLISKWAIADPTIFLLHEPTQGVDVGAKRQVFIQLNKLAREGAAILISSVEYDDLANLCTRVHVIRDGRIVETFEGEGLRAHDLAAAVHQR
jgi:ribose transport system ATP-binding protein